MSAGAGGVTPRASRDLGLLAPRFRTAVDAALAEARAAGLEAMLFEAFRSDALQALYYARGRTIVPPATPVTNARSNLYSWHGYGLAVDVIHATKLWSPPGGLSWFARLAAVFARHGCAWGGEWRSPDPPHFQWGACKPSPSDLARLIRREDGVKGVWRAVGAQ